MQATIIELEKLDAAALRQRLIDDFAEDVDDFIASHPHPSDRFLISLVRMSHLSLKRRAESRAGVVAELDGAEASTSDFEHWARMPTWSSDETAALLAGLEPRKVIHLWERIADASAESEAAKRFADIQVILRRVNHGDMSSYWAPLQAMAWARQFEIVIPDALGVAVSRMWCVMEQAQEPTPSPKLRSDREQTLLRVIAGVWALSSLPDEPTRAADKVSGLFDGWGWEKPTKATIAETVLTPAAQLDRIRK